jgi:hypothetical protein
VDQFGQRDIIVDDKGDVTFAADCQQRFCKARSLVLVQALHAELERRHGRSIERTDQALRKVSTDFERGYKV